MLFLVFQFDRLVFADPVDFDTHLSVPYKDVTPKDFKEKNPELRIVEAMFRITANFDVKEDAVENIVYVLGFPEEVSIAVARPLPPGRPHSGARTGPAQSRHRGPRPVNRQTKKASDSIRLGQVTPGEGQTERKEGHRSQGNQAVPGVQIAIAQVGQEAGEAH
jgi:hypothetical protein